MIKAKRKFSQVKMEKLLRHSAIHVEPMFGITPEAFDPVQVVTPFRSSPFFSHDDMLASDRQASVSLPVISVIETAGSRVFHHQVFNDTAASPLDREDAHHPVTLKDAEDNDFPGNSP